MATNQKDALQQVEESYEGQRITDNQDNGTSHGSTGTGRQSTARKSSKSSKSSNSSAGRATGGNKGGHSS